MRLTDQQKQIVAHFASHVPAAERALFEVRVLKGLQHCRGGNLGQQTTRVCLDNMIARQQYTHKTMKERAKRI